MFARLLALPFVGFALLFLYLGWTRDGQSAIWMAPFLVVAAVIFVMSPQINWWWYSRRPPDLSPGLASLLGRQCGFYRRLDAAGKTRFRQRVALFTMGTEWMPMAFPEDEMPPDVQLAIAAQAITVTFGQEDFLFEKFEKVIVYPAPFPTEEYQFAHASELYAPDGCIIFSALQVMQAFMQPEQWYNVALHEYAKAFMFTRWQKQFPELEDKQETWDQLHAASGMPRAFVEAMIGLAGVNPMPVAIHHYFVFPERFREVFPVEAEAFDQAFDLQNLQDRPALPTPSA